MINLTPDINCSICPRLKNFREENKEKFPTGWNAPVPTWGNIDSELLVVGLAPGLKGANLTGRPFTGDYAGILLYNTLIKYKFASGTYQADPNDGLTLINCKILNAVRCVPPQNKPTTQEEKNCRPYLKSAIENMMNLKIILALGVIAHKNILSCFNILNSKVKFKHGQYIQLNEKISLVDSYHVSKYNTSTRLLTTEMFENLIESIHVKLD